MNDELVMDASVAVKCLIAEEQSDAAVALSLSGPSIVAPRLRPPGAASVVAKKVRRGEIPPEDRCAAFAGRGPAVRRDRSREPLIARAFELATEHGFSVYDGIYLALAEIRKTRVVTADAKLASKSAGGRRGPPRRNPFLKVARDRRASDKAEVGPEGGPQHRAHHAPRRRSAPAPGSPAWDDARPPPTPPAPPPPQTRPNPAPRPGRRRSPGSGPGPPGPRHGPAAWPRPAHAGPEAPPSALIPIKARPPAGCIRL